MELTQDEDLVEGVEKRSNNEDLSNVYPTRPQDVAPVARISEACPEVRWAAFTGVFKARANGQEGG